MKQIATVDELLAHLARAFQPRDARTVGETLRDEASDLVARGDLSTIALIGECADFLSAAKCRHVSGPEGKRRLRAAMAARCKP
jgi:hypothetical protein